MKITRMKDGEVSVIPETLDDLWHLKYIIERGDLIFATTKRAVEVASDKIRPDKPEKKAVRLGIRVEKVEFHRFSNRLRVSGVIEHGVDVGSHHTINIEKMTEVSIIKEWKKDQLERLKEAEKSSKRPSVIILTIEEGYASIGAVMEFGVEEICTITRSYGKRGERDEREEFFNEVYRALKDCTQDVDVVIVAGPGFTKKDFLEHLKDAEMSKKIMVEGSSSCGMPGFIEVIRRGVLQRVFEDFRLTKETKLIDEVLRRISKGEAVAYGFDEVKKAVEYGAVETLLVVDEILREERDKGTDIDSLLTDVERSGGEVVILSSEFEAGKRLLHIGGVAALLRFSI